MNSSIFVPRYFSKYSRSATDAFSRVVSTRGFFFPFNRSDPTAFPGYFRKLDDGSRVAWVSPSDQLASGSTRLQNSIGQIEELVSQGIEIRGFPEDVFSMNGNTLNWHRNTLHSINGETLNDLDAPYIKKHTYFNGRSDLDIPGLTRIYSVKKRVGIDVELPLDIDNINIPGHPNHMKFANGRVDLLELDINVDEYYEMIQSGDLDIIHAQYPEVIIVPGKTNNGGLLLISEKQRLMEDSLDIIDGKYHISILTDTGVSQISLGDTLAPINRLEGILCGNYANDGIEKQIYFQTPFSSTDQAIADAHELRQANEIYDNDIHRQNELHGLSGGDTKFRDESLSLPKMVLNNIATYNSGEVKRLISALETAIINLDVNDPVDKKRIDEFKKSVDKLKRYDDDFSQILNRAISDARRYKLATESILSDNIKAFESSLEKRLHRIEFPIDLNQHRMTWDKSGIGIALPTNDADSFRLTSGSLLDEFFLEPNKEFANLNKLLGQNNAPLSNDAVAKLIDSGKINVIPAKKIPTKGGDSFVAGPYIIVDDRILLPNYKINPDGSKVLVDFRNEQLISQGVNSNGVPFSFVDISGGNSILSDGSTKMWQKLDTALAGDASAGQTALAETKISSIPNFQAGTVLSEKGDQAQAEIQTIITEYSLMRDLNARQDHLNSLSIDEWTDNANEFSMLDARGSDRDFGLPPDNLGYHATGERAFSGRSAVDRTSIDMMNIRMIKERQDRLLKDSLMLEKIILPELDAAGNIVARERTTLEIYQRSIVTGLDEAKSDTSSFLGTVSTINLWGAADQMRMADDIASKWMYKGKSGSEELMTRMKGVYDIDGQVRSTQGMHSPRSLVFQDGVGKKNIGWVHVNKADAHINSLSKVEFSGGSSLSIGDAFNSEFALLNRINGRPATVSQVVDNAGSSQMIFFGYDGEKFSEEVRFKEWWRRFKDQWSTIGKDMPPGVSRDLHEILRHRKVQNFLAYRLKIQWDLLRSLVGDIDLNPSLLISGGASATMFLRIRRIILP